MLMSVRWVLFRTDALPDVTPQLANVKLKSPIEQQMMGHGGLFRQQNIERRKVMSVREWAEFCAKEDMRAPGVKDIGLHARAANGAVRAKTRRARTKTTEPESAEAAMTPEVVVKEEDDDSENAHRGQEQTNTTPRSSPNREAAEPAPISSAVDGPPAATDHDRLSVAPSIADSGTHASRAATPEAEHQHAGDDLPKPKGRRKPQTKESREAALALRADKDKAFLDMFSPHKDWLPPNTSNDDYTHDFCKELERRYWRHCGLGKSAWYGADMAGECLCNVSSPVCNLRCRRVPIHGRNKVVERGTSPIGSYSATPDIRPRTSWGQHAISLFWDVAGYICLAC